ncbi:YciI family protein [Devosia sp. XJ19-1]|uniref:YciI family protein n=1 Tax=Devosia ureilytica TaxID=2952754 RepID=A0A9Q4FR18_9HYPH|nr:YciI family protein [Devosia ureilytica]MCP8882721.1 YciI family protein [Devosia ureilytica]MCP8886911.1 YciI family protein [Devosia ureilytica]
MLYAILCYNEENVVSTWTQEEDDACMARLFDVQSGMAGRGKLGPVVRLWNTDEAKTLKKTNGEPVVFDGPFAETKEQFLGFYVADCADMDEALGFAKDLAKANPGTGSYEIRPLRLFSENKLASTEMLNVAAE